MRLMTFGSALLVTLIGFVVAWQFVDPAPPHSITIATGHPDGAYYLYAERYRELLADEGVELKIRTTAGSLENIDLLLDDSAGVDLAFVQGGTGGAAAAGRLVSLGSLYHEPLWIFHRDTLLLSRITELRDRRIAIGEPGSGTHAIAELLLADNGIAIDAGTIRPIGGEAADRSLLEGGSDALFVVAAPSAPLVRKLLHAPGIRLLSMTRAAAYTRRHHFLDALTLPEGAIDLQANIPPSDVQLLSATANLVARDGFHPALVSLLLQTATRVHGAGDLFTRPGAFPSRDNLEFPLDEDARRYYRHGPPFLQRYLPFWTASLIDRLKVMLVPLLTLMLPLIKIMPPTYRWQVRKKIYRWYRELQALDDAVTAARGGEPHAVQLQNLDALEDEVRQVRVPLSYADELYDLRLHIDLVRNRLSSAGRQYGSARGSGRRGGD